MSNDLMERKLSEMSGKILRLNDERWELRKLLQSIVTDVEAMRVDTPKNDLTRDKQYQGHWFGGFSAYDLDFGGDYNEEMSFQWPCLGILIDKAKELLK